MLERSSREGRMSFDKGSGTIPRTIPSGDSREVDLAGFEWMKGYEEKNHLDLEGKGAVQVEVGRFITCI
jgi:hypothetical protein